MIPVIAIVGRSNVGKSTLFNQLTQSRDALVIDMPGVTRDRQYGKGKVGDKQFIVIDTGGLGGEGETIFSLMTKQAQQAIQEADSVLFIVSAQDGLTLIDQKIAQQLRQANRTTYLVVNKIDGVNANVVFEFYQLGIGEPHPVAAKSGRGINALMEKVLSSYPLDEALSTEEEKTEDIKIAVIGRPNVGKSTLVNHMLGEERVIVYDEPGTTRDSIHIPFKKRGKSYLLIDTAGVRRRAKIKDELEKFSVVKTLRSIEEANVVVLIIDAQEGVTEQDLHLLSFIIKSGRALTIALNKCDALSKDAWKSVKKSVERRLNVVNFVDIHFISALQGKGVGNIFLSINKAYVSATKDLSTPQITRILESALEHYQPPLVKGRRIKLRYAHIGGKNPPVIVIHGNQTKSIPLTYQRYLVGYFQEALKLRGTPLHLEFRTGENPYEKRQNRLTSRQVRKRRRLLRDVRR